MELCNIQFKQRDHMSMKKETISADTIWEMIEKHKVGVLQLQFSDILGRVKTIKVPANQVMKIIDDGVYFDGSSVVGYATIEESDMVAVPDRGTFCILPDSNESFRNARMVCDIYTADGARFEGDPRYILKKTMDRAEKELGIFNIGPEFEFFLFQLSSEGIPAVKLDDHGTYFDMMPRSRAEAVKDRVCRWCNEIGFFVETYHHEVAPSQHEIDLCYGNALDIADRIMILKYLIRTAALEEGLFASFMPKPIAGVCGNGMHVHQSLITPAGKNIFADESKENGLSDIAMYYMGGLLEHASETCAILNSSVNSFKRLVPGYEAPVYISWAFRNRSALLRIPSGRGMSTRIEVRNPDPAGNPYLQFALMLAAGLDGIEKKTMPPDHMEMDIFSLSPGEREKCGIEGLPGSLISAIGEMEKSKLVKDTLGQQVMDHFKHVKEREWDEYRSQVTEWEIRNLLPVL